MSELFVRAIRGAISVPDNDPEAIASSTQELLLAMTSRNQIAMDDIISILFTATPDLTAAFPATAARAIGFTDVPLMCATEIAVPESLPRCVRVLLHTYSHLARHEIQHVYLREAVNLRDDTK